MMLKIMTALKGSIKLYEVKSEIGNDDALTALLAAEVYKAIIQKPAPVRKPIPPPSKPVAVAK